MADDVYDDPDNILDDTDDSVDGAVELPADEQDDPSQSIFNPELGDDDRGGIPELDEVDSGLDFKGQEPEAGPTSALPEEETGSDANHPGDMDPVDERDGTEN